MLLSYPAKRQAPTPNLEWMLLDQDPQRHKKRGDGFQLRCPQTSLTYRFLRNIRRATKASGYAIPLRLVYSP